jgi:hypothetical protein
MPSIDHLIGAAFNVHGVEASAVTAVRHIARIPGVFLYAIERCAASIGCARRHRQSITTNDARRYLVQALPERV